VSEASAEGRSLPPVCILAGGLGTRLGELAKNTPKALLEVAGEPFTRHQLRLLAANGASRIVLCVGHLGEMVEDAIGDGRDLGLDVAYSHDPPGKPGTGAAVRQALPLLEDGFLVLYGDTYLRIDYRDFAEAFARSVLPAQMAVLRNEGRWDTSNADFDGELVRYDKAHPDPSMSWIDYGLGAFRSEVFASGPGAELDELEAVYSELSRQGRLGGYPARERFYEIGTPESLAETDEFLRSELG
jgi:NDP-sugar pyrophosphorylase family protein